MRVSNTKLPQIAREFLRAHSSPEYERVLRAFYGWMAKWKLGLDNLKRAHIESFIRCPQGQNLCATTQEKYRRHLARYLVWLHEKEALRFDPKCFRKTQKLSLPKTAEMYVRSIEPTRKTGTISSYGTSLRYFHRWLDDHGVSLEVLDRQNMSDWLVHLSNSKIAPHTVNQRLVFVRSYLRWLYENGFITSFPDDLVRRADMLKEPKYLPRPLPPAADKELQERLDRAGDIYSCGLLLMRWTGLRIGELRALDRNCVRRDHLSNRFLKVPLGKLDNERLVPLDDRAVLLINQLRGTGEQTEKKTFLIETKTGKKTRDEPYTEALKAACEGLETDGKMVTHRLRHSYATTLLSAGMSLVGVMKLLGHNSIRMTLRYAEITQETASKEYFEALSRIEHRYAEVLGTGDTSNETNPTKLLGDAIRLIQNLSADNNAIKAFARNIIKRLQKIQADTKKLFQNHTSRLQS